MGNHRIKLVLTLFILMVTVIGVFVVYSGKPQSPVESMAAPRIAKVVPTSTPSTVQKTEVDSPDGKATLVMNKRTTGDNATWTVMVDNVEILKKSLSVGSDLSIPFNTFSPDNKYIFLKENVNGVISYLVLATNGEVIAGNPSPPEIAALFKAKYPDYVITEATGWGGINLIVFNTDEIDGKRGPSFWYEVPTGAFIRLSNRF